MNHLFFQKQPDFCRYLLIGVSPDPNFFFERKDMMLENVLDTQNMVVGPQENFLRRLEVLSKRFFAPMAILKSGSEKSKIQKNLLFLSFLRIGASSDPNFFSSVKI